jgi:hypothetical protein
LLERRLRGDFWKLTIYFGTLSTLDEATSDELKFYSVACVFVSILSYGSGILFIYLSIML